MNTTRLGRQKAAVGIGAVLLLAASLITVATTVGAQSEGCVGERVDFGTDQIFGTDFFGNHLLSRDTPVGGVQLDPVAVSFPAGTYAVTAESTDGYIGRAGVVQTQEQWIADFIDAEGNLLASTQPTGDVPDPDDEDFDFWSGSIGEITLDADAASVVIRHAAPGAPSPNSVRAICIGVDLVAQAPAAIDSSIVVDFDSTGDPSDITVTCGDAEGVTVGGVAVDIGPDDVIPGTTCTVDFPHGDDHACVMSVTATDDDGNDATDAVIVVNGEATKDITFPADIGVDVVVDIDCSPVDDPIDTEVLDSTEEPEPAAETPDPAPAPAPAPAVPDDIDTEVLGQVVTAPVAQAESGDPTFTG